MSDTAPREEIAKVLTGPDAALPVESIGIAQDRTVVYLENSAALLVADAILPIVDRLVAEQREKDATLADEHDCLDYDDSCQYIIAAAIRGGTSE